MSKKTIMVSGGFDPIHVGHVRMIQEAAEYGIVMVIANSDDWLKRKKGFCFMPWRERAEILYAIKGVGGVYEVDDSDGTVCDALWKLRPDYFANGGDRKKDNTPEMDICENLGIEMLWGVGGDDKANSSSHIVKKAIETVSNRHIEAFRNLDDE
tara:strand:+ start:14730 stop:15191 length:462 start_codon:yes stop_codon:yes gene_type:complete